MKRVFVIILALSVMICQAGTIAYADTMASKKEEVVYVNLMGNGDVDTVHAVNIFTNQKNITDFGEYSSVKNLTTTDKIDVDGDKISISTDSDKLYYQGELGKKDIPWNISIKYYLNGKEMDADSIAGKSGKFRMTIAISENKNCDSSFFNGYALQAALNLDSYTFRNIIADGATMANEGGKIKLTYIILPGTEKKLEITAQAQNINIDSMSINGVRLNLDMDFDSSQLLAKTELLKQKVKELNLGTGELNDKAGILRKGAKNINAGSEDLEKGIATLGKGTEELEKGAIKMESALKEADVSPLIKGSEEFLEGLTQFQEYAEKIEFDVEKLQKLTEVSTEIKNGIIELEDGLSQMESQISDYEEKVADSLSEGGLEGTEELAEKNKKAAKAIAILEPDLAKLLMANAAYIEGSAAEIDGLKDALSEDSELREGVAKLSSSYELFDQNISKLADTLYSMASDFKEMKGYLNTFTQKYEEIDKGISNYSNGINQIRSGFEGIYNGIISIADGTDDLMNGSSRLADGTLEMYDGAVAFEKGTGKLFDGTKRFNNSVKNIDSDIEEEIADTIAEKTGKNQPIKSFVSEKNDKVESVLFVMKTQKIEIEKTEKEEESEKKKVNIFQKFIALFKL